MLRLLCSGALGRLGSACTPQGEAVALQRCLVATTAAGGGDDERERMINKLLYRSRQRGFLELDLLVGLWAEQEVPRMDTHTLQQFAVVLDQENPDLFKWLTGQQEAPSDLQANPAFASLKQHVEQQLSDSCHEATQAAPGKEWLRGWDDSWRTSAKAQQQAAETKAPGGS